MQVLVLTHNILSEQTFQEKLQQLNHEVFCSKIMLDTLKEKPESILKCLFYQVIILSENLSNREVADILAKLGQTNRIILRKVVDKQTKEEIQTMEEWGISDWIQTTVPIDQLREVLSEKLSEQKLQNQKIISFPFNESDQEFHSYKQFISSLSKKEKKVFEKLIASKTQLVSREEFCEYLWQDVPSNSHLSQLSLIVKKIRRKFIEFGLSEDMLITVWGQGYRLTSNFFEECPIPVVEKVSEG